MVDGDAFYTRDIVSMYRAVSDRAGASFVFHDTQPKPMYSYVKREGDSITAIVEKVKISDWACVLLKESKRVGTLVATASRTVLTF